jgi:hypothetical protein
MNVRSVGGRNLYHEYIGFDDVSAGWRAEEAWEGDSIFRASFQAVELTAALALWLEQDRRPYYLRRRERWRSLLEAARDQIQLGSALLRKGVRGGARVIDSSSQQTTLWEFAAVCSAGGLDEEPSLASMVLPYLAKSSPGIGIEGALFADLADGLLPISTAAFLEYDRLVRPERVRGMLKAEPLGPEDQFFRVVHQVTECWFHVTITLLSRANASAVRHEWDEWQWSLAQVSEIFEYLGEHIQLLRYMVMEDYHRVRVALRGASGAQSTQAASIRQLLKKQWTAVVKGPLSKCGTVEDVLRHPTQHPEEYDVLWVLSRLEQSYGTFLYRHYQMAIMVQSIQGPGALGGGVEQLARRVTQPFYADLDVARWKHLLSSTLDNAVNSGSMFAPDAAPRMRYLTSDEGLARTTAERYLDLFSKLSFDKCESLMNSGGQIEDPVGSRPVGRHEWHAYSQTLATTYAAVTFERKRRSWRAGVFRIRWYMTATLRDETVMRASGAHAFSVNRDGSIQYVRVEWDPAARCADDARPSR